MRLALLLLSSVVCLGLTADNVSPLSPLPMAAPLVVSAKPLALFPMSERRDSVVLREARWAGLPERIAYAVTHAENWGGDTTAVSTAGAVGVMQIMPVHWDAWRVECYGDRKIVDMHRNACIGVHLLLDYHGEAVATREALLGRRLSVVERSRLWGRVLRRYLGFRRNIKAWMQYTDDIIAHMVLLD